MQVEAPMRPAGGRLCGGRRKNGEACGGAAITGTDRCRMHAGRRGRAAKAAGAVAREVSAWGLTDETVDPAETLLRLLAQSRRRADLYADLLQKAFDGDPDFPAELGGAGLSALVGHKYALTRDGDPVAVEEAVRGLAELEAAERDRCARFAKLALDAGIAERQVRLAEQQGAMVADVIDRVLAALGLSDEQRALVPTVVPRELRAVTAG